MPVLNRFCQASLIAVACLAGPPAQVGAQSVPGVSVTEPGRSAMSQRIVLGLDKSSVIELDRPAADVVITNSDVADAVVQTRKRIIFRGVAVGQTNAFVYDDAGTELLNLEITVEPDLTDLNALIERLVPDGRIKAEPVAGGVLLTGNVENESQAQQVKDLVGMVAGEDAKIVDMLSASATDQVLLEVRVVEMQRSYLKQLGINPSTDTGFGDLANLVPKELFEGDPPVSTGQEALVPGVPFSNNATAGFTSNSPPSGFTGNFTYQNFVGDDLQSSTSLAVEALERVGIARTLAEPNLTAVSGETAKFLAGGEFPVPTPPDENGVVGIEFKQFGVGLGFTPVVLSEDRISLQVSTEVSELTSEGTSSVDVPALSVRRVDSTVELPSGKSMMLAGLIQSRTRQDLDKVPGIKDVPVLGQLFQSREFASDETELVVIITPYLVDPTNKRELTTPADGFESASDMKTLLFGKLNRVYAKDGEGVSGDAYKAPVGFIEE